MAPEPCPRLPRNASTRDAIVRASGDIRLVASIAGMPRSAGTDGGHRAGRHPNPMPDGCGPRRMRQHHRPRKVDTTLGEHAAMPLVGWWSCRRAGAQPCRTRALRWPRPVPPPAARWRAGRSIGPRPLCRSESAADVAPRHVRRGRTVRRSGQATRTAPRQAAKAAPGATGARRRATADRAPARQDAAARRPRADSSPAKSPGHPGPTARCARGHCGSRQCQPARRPGKSTA